jgi:outer membrane biosynthesis protein TonB
MRIHMAVVLVLGGCAAEEPAPATSPPLSATAPAATSAALPAAAPDPDMAAVLAALPAFHACYDKARTANPALAATRVTIKADVDKTGTVTNIDLDYRNHFDEAAKGCMRDAAFAIKFPTGDARKVEVPLSFGAK